LLLTEAGEVLDVFAPFFGSITDKSIGFHKLQPEASAARMTTWRGGISLFMISSPSTENINRATHYQPDGFGSDGLMSAVDLPKQAF
jgi:hypothetical protein